MVTDHKALVSFLKSRVLNKRLHGWVLDFDFEIVYRPGKDNQDADALSRQAWDSLEGDPCRADNDDVAVEGDSRLVQGDVGTTHIKTEEISSERNAKTESIT